MKHLIKGTNSLEVIQMPEKLLRKAVLNQIAWWKAVCATHHITTACMDNVWIADQYVPSYYPEMITETREATVEKFQTAYRRLWIVMQPTNSRIHEVL